MTDYNSDYRRMIEEKFPSNGKKEGSPSMYEMMDKKKRSEYSSGRLSNYQTWQSDQELTQKIQDRYNKGSAYSGSGCKRHASYRERELSCKEGKKTDANVKKGFQEIEINSLLSYNYDSGIDVKYIRNDTENDRGDVNSELGFFTGSKTPRNSDRNRNQETSERNFWVILMLVMLFLFLLFMILL